jgi:hypothetical protein
LPFVERAWIPEEKLTQYALNPHHEVGGSKAQLFENRFGIVRADWEFLRDQILDALPCLPACRVQTIAPKRWHDAGRTRHGIECEVHVPIVGRNRRHGQIPTGWMLDGALAPRLTTAWPLGK